MPRLNSASTQTLQNAALGPGVIICNLKDRTLTGIRNVIRRTAPASETGRLLGAMTAVPTVNISPEYQNVLEDVVGLPAVLRGAQQIQTTEVTCEAELVELRPENLHLIHPGLDQTAWLNGGTRATLTVGATTSGVVYTADEAGTGGNAISVAHVVPAGANVPLSVAVSGNAITVTLATGATAGTATSTAAQVAAAVNAHLGAKVLVDASVLTAPGGGVAVAAASAPLAGGTNGTEVGRSFRPRGFVSDSDYQDNLVICFESTSSDLFLVIELYNVLSTDDVEIQPDDSGSASGIGVTWTAHADDYAFDPNTGAYRPPYKINWAAPPVAVA